MLRFFVIAGPTSSGRRAPFAKSPTSRLQGVQVAYTHSAGLRDIKTLFAENLKSICELHLLPSVDYAEPVNGLCLDVLLIDQPALPSNE